jgi:hypothetical protein
MGNTWGEESGREWGEWGEKRGSRGEGGSSREGRNAVSLQGPCLGLVRIPLSSYSKEKKNRAGEVQEKG